MVQLFHELRERLLRAGIAPRHARRYLNELTDHLADLTAEEERAGRHRKDAQSAALVRLGGIDELAQAMTQQRNLQSWSARAPWAAFGLAPVALLAAVWLVALVLLWSGWLIFLPGADTPFGASPGPHRIFDLSNVYFQFDRALFFGAPILIGWGIGLVAARQRMKAVWPGVGLLLIALIADLVQVHAGLRAVPHGLGHISLSFALAPTLHGGPLGLLQMLVLPMTALPYLFWRWRQASLPSS